MKILFDETQNERGKIFDNFQKLAKLLEESGHEVGKLDSYPIKFSTISKSDILVFLCPDGSKLYGHEVKALLRFVDEGGAVAIFANAGGDKGLNTNMNTLLKHFNMEIIANQIFDYQNFDLKLESNPVVTKFFDHPIIEGVKDITLVSGCSIQISKGAGELARTSGESDPPSATVMAISSYGLGTVFVCGSYLMFSDKKSGIDLRNNAVLAQNIFNHIAAPPMITKDEEIEEIEEPVAEEKPDIVIKEKKEKEPYESVSRIDLVKDALSSKGETDAVKNEVIKAMQTLRDEVKSTKVDTSEPEPKMSKGDIYEAIAIIQELEKDVAELDIEDPGYRDILLTDMARREGIDYSQVLPYLEKLREKEQRDKKKKVDRKKASSKTKADISSIPEPRIPEMDQFEKDLMIFDQEVESKRDVTPAAPAASTEMIGELVQSIKELKGSVDVLSANLIHLLSEIVLEMKAQKGKRK